MTAFNALTDGYLTSPDPGPVPGQPAASPAHGPAPVQGAAAVQGMPPLFGQHNTPLHVAFLGLIAMGLVIVLRAAGFKFALAGGVGLGR